ncbi:MAG TPA: SPOR domain-containing protein [Actinomycetales bacterium]|nr:SPOR domain-containing protein [Actinomycetales bacterium]
MAAAKDKWWFNLSTKTVERGRQSGWRTRIGPYDTREEAQAALESAAERTAYWDEQEKREREEEDLWGEESEE